MSAGSRIFIVVLVLAFLGTGLYYLVIADSKGPAPALAPLVAEPEPQAAAEVIAPLGPEVPPIETPIASDTLAVRVAVAASDPVGVNVPERRQQFGADGPNGIPNGKAEWYPLFEIDLFAEDATQRIALDKAPVSYFRERFGLIVEPHEASLYVLLYTTPGRSVAPSDYRGVEVLSVREVGDESTGSRRELEIALGSQAAQRLTRAAGKNVSRMWAILVDEVVVEIQRITSGKKSSLTIASGFDTETMTELEEAIAGKVSIEPATFTPGPSAAIAGTADPAITEPVDPVLAASRTSTIESEEASEATAPVTTRPVTPAVAKKTRYVVKSGDTMSSIAEAWFGAPRDWSRIAEANPQLDPNRLSVGQVIMLPPKNAKSTSSVTKPTTPTTGGKTYTVRSGDSLATISRAIYGSDGHWKLLYGANKNLIGANPEALKVGAVLSIPPLPKKSS